MAVGICEGFLSLGSDAVLCLYILLGLLWGAMQDDDGKTEDAARHLQKRRPGLACLSDGTPVYTGDGNGHFGANLEK
jgi:hypothetical protein